MGSLTDQQKKVLAITLVIHVILLRLTWYDLSRRPDAGVRGKKRMWKLASTLNTTGSIAYWLFGRKSVPGPEAARTSELAPTPVAA
jgi:hypothetical protein